MPKTQILITDVPTAYFKEKWPEQLEKDLFDTSFPQFRSQLLYYTPLLFLNRIIIIMDNEDTTVQIFGRVKELLALQQRKVKLYLTESLLSKPKAKSSEDLSLSSPERSSHDMVDQRPSRESQASHKSQKDKPILTIDTDPSNTGISSSSLSVGSPSLSPDRTSLESPTMLKFDSQSKMHYYKEPLPRLNKRDSESTIGSSSNDNTTYLFKPKKVVSSSALATDMNTSAAHHLNIPPPSPSITLNEFHL